MALCDPLATGLQLKQAGPWGPTDHKLLDSRCDTYFLSSYWGLDSCNGAQAHSAQVTHGYEYATYDTATTDSAFSDQDVLACNELLHANESFLDDPEPQQRPASKAPVPFFNFSTPAQHEVRETIKNDMGRERETQPQFYFKRHDFLSKELRGTAVSWAIQVVQQFNVEQETLFLAISYLDRFLSITADVVHLDGLHLATLACLSLAAKQAEVMQPSTAEWTVLVQNNSWGTKEQLARMEWIVMENLEWRGCTPTAWWFLHLFCYGLGTCPAPAICMAAYLLELGLLEAGCLAYQYSTLAAAALLLGDTMDFATMQGSMEPASGGPMLTARALLELAPELNLHQVQDACGVLAELHARACALPHLPSDQAAEGLQLARTKFSSDMWHHVGLYTRPVNLKATLERF